MKQTSKLAVKMLVIFLAIGMGVTLGVGCPPDPDNGGTGTNPPGQQTGTNPPGQQTGTNPPGQQTGTNPPGNQTGTNTPPTVGPEGFAYWTPAGTYRNWSLRYKGENNNYSGSFVIASVADPDGTNALAFNWGSSVSSWLTIEFQANVPGTFPLGEYNGVFLEIMPQATHDYVIMMRRTGRDGAWVWPGLMINDGLYTYLGYAFENAAPQWGASGYLDEFIQSNGATGMQLNICPQFNPGAPANVQANTQYTDYIKNIGFYKGEDPDYADYSMVIWKG